VPAIEVGQCVFRPGGVQPPVQEVNAFIDEYRARCGVEPICSALQVAPSAYRRHAARQRDPALLSARALWSRQGLAAVGVVVALFGNGSCQSSSPARSRRRSAAETLRHGFQIRLDQFQLARGEHFQDRRSFVGQHQSHVAEDESWRDHHDDTPSRSVQRQRNPKADPLHPKKQIKYVKVAAQDSLDMMVAVPG